MFNVDEPNKFQLISHLIVYSRTQSKQNGRNFSSNNTIWNLKKNMLLMLLKTEIWSRKQFSISSPGDVRSRFLENILRSKASRFQLPVCLDAK